MATSPPPPRRLFVALELPPEVRAALAGWRPEIAGARWVAAEKLHLTVRFLGPTAEDRLGALTASMDRLASPPVPLRTGALLRLPSARRPRALTVEVAASRELAALAGRLDRLLAAADVGPREQPLLPHVTLARFRPPTPAVLRKALRGLDPPAAAGLATAVALVESRSGEGGATYVTRHRVALAETAHGAGG